MNQCADQSTDLPCLPDPEADNLANPNIGKQSQSASGQPETADQQTSPETWAAGKKDSWLVW